MTPVDLDRQKFEGFYVEYSLKNKAYFKFDSFIKAGDSSQSTLRNIGSFLTSICNFKCTPFPNSQNMESIYGSAVISLKNPESGGQTNYPILVEVQAYP